MRFEGRTSNLHNFNPLKGKGVNWLHFAMQANLHFYFLAFGHSGAQPVDTFAPSRVNVSILPFTVQVLEAVVGD